MTAAVSSEHAGRAIGAMFFAFFGAAWLAWWSLEQFDGAILPILIAIGTGGVAILLLALRQFLRNRAALAGHAETPYSRRAKRVFNLVNAVQWVTIVLTVLVLANTGHADWIRVAIIFIVGAHFLPLAAVFRYRWHYVTGGALVVLAMVYPFLTPAGPLNPIGLLGAGTILWASALVAVVPQFRGAPQEGLATRDKGA